MVLRQRRAEHDVGRGGRRHGRDVALDGDDLEVGARVEHDRLADDRPVVARGVRAAAVAGRVAREPDLRRSRRRGGRQGRVEGRRRAQRLGDRDGLLIVAGVDHDALPGPEAERRLQPERGRANRVRPVECRPQRVVGVLVDDDFQVVERRGDHEGVRVLGDAAGDVLERDRLGVPAHRELVEHQREGDHLLAVDGHPADRRTAGAVGHRVGRVTPSGIRAERGQRLRLHDLPVDDRRDVHRRTRQVQFLHRCAQRHVRRGRGRRRVGNARDPHRLRVLRLVEDQHVTDGASHGVREAQARIAGDGARSVGRGGRRLQRGGLRRPRGDRALRVDQRGDGAEERRRRHRRPGGVRVRQRRRQRHVRRGRGRRRRDDRGDRRRLLRRPGVDEQLIAGSCGRSCSAAGSRWRRPRRPG